MRYLQPITKFTYSLEKYKDNGIGSDKRSVINDKFTYKLDMDEEDGIIRQEDYKQLTSSCTSWTRKRRMGWNDLIRCL